jgi:hypothetical protein
MPCICNSKIDDSDIAFIQRAAMRFNKRPSKLVLEISSIFLSKPPSKATRGCRMPFCPLALNSLTQCLQGKACADLFVSW